MPKLHYIQDNNKQVIPMQRGKKEKKNKTSYNNLVLFYDYIISVKKHLYLFIYLFFYKQDTVHTEVLQTLCSQWPIFQLPQLNNISITHPSV